MNYSFLKKTVVQESICDWAWKFLEKGVTDSSED